jgi:radical SAM superfamily enzyme YgiQ (UPF0313 family)
MKSNRDYKKILLMLLPFHPPLIPPLGPACLKSFLTPQGYDVKTVNANRDEGLNESYTNYFDVLARYIPPGKQANFYNIGNEVLRNHLMAFSNRTDPKEYTELVRQLVGKTFYCEFADELVGELDKIVSDYYIRLENYFLPLLVREKPDVLGLSVFKGTVPSSLFVFKLAKDTCPDILTVMGGGVFADQLSYGSPDLQFFMEKTPYIDKIIIGEGEHLFLKLLQGELPQSRRVYTQEDIQPHLVDVTGVPVPDFSDFDVDYYPYLANYTSRSCPFQCSFCGETVMWGKYRKKKPGQMAGELKELYEKYHRRLFLLCDSLLNPTMSELSKSLIKADVPVYFDGYLRIDKAVCDIRHTMQWRQGGFYRARLGVESGSQRVLDMMDKKISVQQIKDGVAGLAFAGIKTTTYWIAGYPGETEADFQATLDIIEEMKDNIYEAEANPFWYFLNALVKSDEWAGHCELLFPGSARDMLILQTRFLNIEPSPEERYNRLNRFVRHCSRLGIPNPYSLSDIYNADRRWKRLHNNAVPMLTDFYSSKGNEVEDNICGRRKIMRSTNGAGGELSHAQVRYWNQWQNRPTGPSGGANPWEGHRPGMVVSLDGTLDVKILEKALAEVMARHDILRTTYGEGAGGPIRIVHPDASIPLDYHDLSSIPLSGQEEKLAGYIIDAFNREFHPGTGPLWWVTLYKINPARYLLLFTASSLSFDDRSISIILEDLAGCYNALQSGNGDSHFSPVLQYGDYVEWSRERIKNGHWKHQEDVWGKYLKEEIPAAHLPYDYEEGVTPGEAAEPAEPAKIFVMKIGAGIAAKLHNLANRQDTSLFVTILAILNTWLSVVSNQTIITVGTFFPGRTHPELEKLPGQMMNLQPLRVNLSGNLNFRQILSRTKKIVLEAVSNRDYPFETAAQKMEDHPLPHKDIYSLVFSWRETSAGTVNFNGLHSRVSSLPAFIYEKENGKNGFIAHKYTLPWDLALEMSTGKEDSGEITLIIWYNHQRFRSRSIELYFNHFNRILESSLADPEQRLSQLPLVEIDELDELF